MYFKIFFLTGETFRGPSMSPDCQWGGLVEVICFFSLSERLVLSTKICSQNRSRWAPTFLLYVLTNQTTASEWTQYSASQVRVFHAHRGRESHTSWRLISDVSVIEFNLYTDDLDKTCHQRAFIKYRLKPLLAASAFIRYAIIRSTYWKWIICK